MRTYALMHDPIRITIMPSGPTAGAVNSHAGSVRPEMCLHHAGLFSAHHFTIYYYYYYYYYYTTVIWDHLTSFIFFCCVTAKKLPETSYVPVRGNLWMFWVYWADVFRSHSNVCESQSLSQTYKPDLVKRERDTNKHFQDQREKKKITHITFYLRQ